MLAKKLCDTLCCSLQNKKANIEAYLAKLSLASRKAEYLVKEFEGQGAGTE